MPHSENLAERPLGRVIEAIASDDVAPGAGSAAAVGLALAAACASKAVAITSKHRQNDAVLARTREALGVIAHRALRGADEDALRFRAFMHEKDEASAQELIDSSKRLQQLGSELLAVLDELKDCVDPPLSGDLEAARALCTAFIEIQSENLEQNSDSANQLEWKGGSLAFWTDSGTLEMPQLVNYRSVVLDGRAKPQSVDMLLMRQQEGAVLTIGLHPAE
jgi:formiminotetrahydrofolate cyclodeaminase